MRSSGENNRKTRIDKTETLVLGFKVADSRSIDRLRGGRATSEFPINNNDGRSGNDDVDGKHNKDRLCSYADGATASTTVDNRDDRS